MKTRYLFLLMAVLVAIMVGTFIWFVATWSPEDNPSLSEHHLPLRVGENTHLATRATLAGARGAMPPLPHARPDGKDQRS